MFELIEVTNRIVKEQICFDFPAEAQRVTRSIPLYCQHLSWLGVPIKKSQLVTWPFATGTKSGNSWLLASLGKPACLTETRNSTNRAVAVNGFGEKSRGIRSLSNRQSRWAQRPIPAVRVIE